MIIKELCKELGVTQKELAVKLGVNVSTVTAWARGKSKITPMVLKCFDLLRKEKEYNALKEILASALKDKIS